MEPALRAVWKDVRIGKILIQTNLDSGEPEVTQDNNRMNAMRALEMHSRALAHVMSRLT